MDTGITVIHQGLNPPRMFYQFNQYELDSESYKLYRDGVLICDNEKSILLLRILCDNYPEVVDKETLIAELWPDQVVTDWSISKLVSEVRQLLDNSGKDQGYIKTIRGKGFRFNSEVSTHSCLQFNQNNNNVTDTHAIKRTLTGSATDDSAASHKFIILNKPIALLASVAVIMAIGFVIAFGTDYFPSKPTNSSTTQPIRIAVLPLENEDNDPINDWLKYGIMSMATEQLSRYTSIQTIPVSTVIGASSAIADKKSLTSNYSEYFEALCGQIGCSHIVAIRYRLENHQNPVLSYQIYDKNKRSVIAEFPEADVIDAADLLLDYLVRDLIPTENQHLSLKDTFSNDKKANRDYAIGVNELHEGDPGSAITYLSLALNKSSNFFWAKAYLAEAYYRSGKLDEASAMIGQLKSSNPSPAQLYFLDHLYSNVLYTLGKLDESLQISISLQENSFAIGDPLLMGNELLNIGSTYQATAVFDKAISYLERAQQQYALAGYGSGEGKALFNLANVYLTMAQEHKALEYYQKAREVFVQFQMPGYELMAKHQIATTSIELGELKYAGSELELIIKRYREMGDLQGELTAEVDFAYVSIAKNDFHTAAKQLEQMIHKLEKTEFSYLKEHARILAVKAYLGINQVIEAEKHFDLIKGQWVDPRPGFVFVPAQLQLAKGNIDQALILANQVKNNIVKDWTAAHQQVLVQFEKAVHAQKVISISY